MNKTHGVKETLLAAADLLEKSPWFSLHPKSPNPPGLHERAFCAGTAVMEVAEDDAEIWNTRLIDRLIEFNDAKGRTKEQVVAYMRELAMEYSQ